MQLGCNIITFSKRIKLSANPFMASQNSQHPLVSSLEFLSKDYKFSRRILMKRRPRLDRCIRPRNPIEKKVRMLKKLIPNCGEFVGAERVLRETADYIVALQMRVKVMQLMVDALSGVDDE